MKYKYILAAEASTQRSTILMDFQPPPSVGGLDLDSRSSGFARLGGGVGPPLGVVPHYFELGLSMLKKLPVLLLRSKAAAEGGEDHTPDTHGYTTAHSGGCEAG